MKNKNIALAGALLVGGLLTFNSIAFADSTDATTSASIKETKPLQKSMSFIKGEFGHKGQKDVLFMKHQGLEEQLKLLVQEGTINQTTADKIQAFLTAQENEIKAEMEKLKAMTTEERKTYFEIKKTDADQNVVIKKVDLFSQMVEKGVITQKEADAIESRLEAIQQAKQQEAIKSSLDKLVQDKTITQAQATKIAEYIAKQQQARIAEKEKLQAMTKEEIAAYFKDNVVKKTDIFAQLVTDKVLTQEQSDAVVKALHLNGHHMGLKPIMIKKFDGYTPKTN